MKLLKKILKYISFAILILIVGLYAFFYNMTSPKSDKKVLDTFLEEGIQPKITHETYKTFNYRKVSIRKDTTLPTFVFVHGTIGSVLDFSRYMSDSTLSSKANMLVYDRIGYNYKEENEVQESIAFEVEMLEDVIKDIPKEKIILVGYSYGGPIALASKQKYKKILLLAPAVNSEIEPMPWMLHFYKWKLTRWLVPPIWKQASKEKLSHKQDLLNFQETWFQNPSDVISVHGNADWIVPYGNSEFLKNQFPKEQFSLVTIPDAGHAFVWSHFAEIKKELLNALVE